MGKKLYISKCYWFLLRKIAVVSNLIDIECLVDFYHFCIQSKWTKRRATQFGSMLSINLNKNNPLDLAQCTTIALCSACRKESSHIMWSSCYSRPELQWTTHESFASITRERWSSPPPHSIWQSPLPSLLSLLSCSFACMQSNCVQSHRREFGIQMSSLTNSQKKTLSTLHHIQKCILHGAIAQHKTVRCTPSQTQIASLE